MNNHRDAPSGEIKWNQLWKEKLHRDCSLLLGWLSPWAGCIQVTNTWKFIIVIFERESVLCVT